MTLKSTIELMKLGFKKQTVTREQSGCDQLFHYFVLEINGISFLLDEINNEWFMVVHDSNYKYFNYYDVVNIIKAFKHAI
jgi:hypothetical protein